jgi:signal transduction histidine kinase/CheY-like chemotaxis protein
MLRTSAVSIIELAVIAFIYFVLVKLGLTLASVNPSASPVWPATGFALAILLLRGYRVWPAIFVAAFLANVSSAGSIFTAATIAVGNSLEGVVSALLINRWSGGVRTFTTPAGIAKFALIGATATAISPAIGVSSLSLGGYAEWAQFGPIFMTWWLGDLSGALIVAPVIVLWAEGPPVRAHVSEALAIFVVAAGIGLIAFSPMIEQTVHRTPLVFLAIVPLVWTALRRDPRETATAALVLSGFAVWGTLAGGGPFSWAGLNESFVLLAMFIVSAAIPSLMLSSMATQLQDSYATLERKVEERTRQLELANLAKSRFIAVASHDLRQPLHALGLFVAQLREHLDSAERNRIVEQIDAAVTSMDELFNDMLDISKLDAGVLVPNSSDFPIASVFKRIESTFGGMAREKGLSFRIVSSGAWVRTDSILLERILLNLVSNAMRYTKEGRVVLGCRRRGQRLHIEVWDTGPGIPEDKRQSVFDEFYRLPGPEHASHPGLGLGLAIVDRLCRLLGHSVELSSVMGEGCVFRIIVPCAAAQADTAHPTDAVHANIDKFNGKLVVVIDDDTLVLDSTGGLLRGWGCRVIAASSGGAALTRLAEYDHPPDLIISDYRLSDDRTGIEAITLLREALNVPVPALLISGDTNPLWLREVRANGYHVLNKPVSPRALRALLSHFFKKHDAADRSI